MLSRLVIESSEIWKTDINSLFFSFNVDISIGLKMGSVSSAERHFYSWTKKPDCFIENSMCTAVRLHWNSNVNLLCVCWLSGVPSRAYRAQLSAVFNAVRHQQLSNTQNTHAHTFTSRNEQTERKKNNITNSVSFAQQTHLIPFT